MTHMLWAACIAGQLALHRNDVAQSLSGLMGTPWDTRVDLYDAMSTRHRLESKQNAVKIMRAGGWLSAVDWFWVYQGDRQHSVKAEATGRLGDVRGKILSAELMKTTQLNQELSWNLNECDILKNCGIRRWVKPAQWLQNRNVYPYKSPRYLR